MLKASKTKWHGNGL